MIDSASASALRPIFLMIGIACFLTSMAWGLQAVLFTGSDGAAAAATWLILSAAIAGVGAAFLIARWYWMLQS